MSEFRVYRNLHESNWTVQAYQPKVGWRKLVGLSSLWTPSDVEFLIGEKARESVRESKRKQVHAYAIISAFQLVGNVRNLPPFDITYSPYNDNGFSAEQRRTDGEPSRYYHNLRGADNGVLFHTDGHIYTNGIQMRSFR